MLPAALVLALFGCRKIEPAPQDVDELMHRYWTAYPSGEDAQVTALVVAGHDLLDVDNLDEPFDGTLSDLDEEEVALVGLDVDPSLASGLFFANILPCDLDVLEQILVAPDPNELYQGNYDSYERVYSSDRDAYLNRDTSTVTWSTYIEGSLVGIHATEHFEGSVRYVDDDESPFGPTLMSRSVMPEAAVLDSNSATYTQDFQIEAYYERAPGEVVHVYGVWHQLDLGAGFDDTNSDVIRFTLNLMADWDDKTAAICEDWP